jgi:hypothetical protein
MFQRHHPTPEAVVSTASEKHPIASRAKALRGKTAPARYATLLPRITPNRNAEAKKASAVFVPSSSPRAPAVTP